jgi:hypothetical protein
LKGWKSAAEGKNYLWKHKLKFRSNIQKYTLKYGTPQQLIYQMAIKRVRPVKKGIGTTKLALAAPSACQTLEECG